MTSIVFSHVGDLGNVYSDERGMISTKIVDHLVSLVGEYSVLGRSFVVSWSNLLTQLYGTSWFEYFPACSWFHSLDTSEGAGERQMAVVVVMETLGNLPSFTRF